MLLGPRRSPQAHLRGAWALLPTGACEAHGPHLPLDTDVRIATAMAVAAAERLHDQGVPAVVLPALPYGITRFARNFPGTVSIPAPLVTALVQAIAASVHAQGAIGLGIANAHFEPAQVDALFAAAEAVRPTLPVAFPNVSSRRNAERLAARVAALDGHSGQYETSLLLAIAPELVDPRPLPPNSASLAEGIMAGATCFEEAGGPHAYFGNPNAATADLGRALLAELAAMLVEGVLSGR